MITQFLGCTSHISSAQQPPVTSGHCGLCSLTWCEGRLGARGPGEGFGADWGAAVEGNVWGAEVADLGPPKNEAG